VAWWCTGYPEALYGYKEFSENSCENAEDDWRLRIDEATG